MSESDKTSAHPLQIRMTPELRKKLNAAAKKEGVSVSEYVRFLVLKELGGKKNGDAD